MSVVDLTRTSTLTAILSKVSAQSCLVVRVKVGDAANVHVTRCTRLYSGEQRRVYLANLPAPSDLDALAGDEQAMDCREAVEGLGSNDLDKGDELGVLGVSAGRIGGDHDHSVRPTAICFCCKNLS